MKNYLFYMSNRAPPGFARVLSAMFSFILLNIMITRDFDPALIRTWLFGPGMPGAAQQAMGSSQADALIVDLEDSTPPALRAQARAGLAELLPQWRTKGILTAVRINSLESDGLEDLRAAMQAGAQVIVYPMAETADQMRSLDAAITAWETQLMISAGRTPILPVCETARGVADVRLLALASDRIHSALMGTEDLATDLCAERSSEATELDYARRRFILECRAARIEPIDAPYTYGDTEGAVREAQYARRLGYRSKSLVQPEHAKPLNAVLTPSNDDVRHAQGIIQAFLAARSRGEDRALVDGLWVEVPTFKSAQRLMERHEQLARRG